MGMSLLWPKAKHLGFQEQLESFAQMQNMIDFLTIYKWELPMMLFHFQVVSIVMMDRPTH